MLNFLHRPVDKTPIVPIGSLGSDVSKTVREVIDYYKKVDRPLVRTDAVAYKLVNQLDAVLRHGLKNDEGNFFDIAKTVFSKSELDLFLSTWNPKNGRQKSTAFLFERISNNALFMDFTAFKSLPNRELNMIYHPGAFLRNQNQISTLVEGKHGLQLLIEVPFDFTSDNHTSVAVAPRLSGFNFIVANDDNLEMESVLPVENFNAVYLHDVSSDSDSDRLCTPEADYQKQDTHEQPELPSDVDNHERPEIPSDIRAPKQLEIPIDVIQNAVYEALAPVVQQVPSVPAVPKVRQNHLETVNLSPHLFVTITMDERSMYGHDYFHKSGELEDMACYFFETFRRGTPSRRFLVLTNQGVYLFVKRPERNKNEAILLASYLYEKVQSLMVVNRQSLFLGADNNIIEMDFGSETLVNAIRDVILRYKYLDVERSGAYEMTPHRCTNDKAVYGTAMVTMDRNNVQFISMVFYVKVQLPSGKRIPTVFFQLSNVQDNISLNREIDIRLDGIYVYREGCLKPEKIILVSEVLKCVFNKDLWSVVVVTETGKFKFQFHDSDRLTSFQYLFSCKYDQILDPPSACCMACGVERVAFYQVFTKTNYERHDKSFDVAHVSEYFVSPNADGPFHIGAYRHPTQDIYWIEFRDSLELNTFKAFVAKHAPEMTPNHQMYNTFLTMSQHISSLRGWYSI